MELIDRYVYDVGRRLPTKQREDIEKELKSLLMDALDARMGGKEPTREDVAAVLREFGSPADVAAKYAGERYVVGPRLYPFYKLVLTIVLCAAAFGLAVSAVIGAVFDASGIADVTEKAVRFFTGFFADAFSAALGAVGGVTILFWIIERIMERNGAKPGSHMKWDPKDLPPVPSRRDDWRPAHSAAALVLTALFLVIINFLPDVIAIYASDGMGQLHRYPLLSEEALAAYLPLWNAGLALSVPLHVALLIRGRWSLATNLGNIALQVYGIAVAGVMMAGPALLNADIAVAGNASLTDALGQVMPALAANFRWVFVLVIIGCVAEAGKSIYRIVREARG